MGYTVLSIISIKENTCHYPKVFESNIYADENRNIMLKQSDYGSFIYK